jgi:hypothetical protein
MLQQASNLVLCATAAARRVRLAPDYDARIPGTLALIERLLDCGSPPAAIASGLRDLLLGRLDITVPPGPAGTSWMLAWLLRHRPGPFTAVVAALAGTAVRVEPDGDSGREHRLTGAQASDLRVLDEDGLRAWSRRGLMMAGDLVAAEVELTVVPSRIGGWDGSLFTRIRAGEPCGAVLPYVVRTVRRGRDHWPADPPVDGAAALGVAGRGIGFARERVSRELITAIP